MPKRTMRNSVRYEKMYEKRKWHENKKTTTGKSVRYERIPEMEKMGENKNLTQHHLGCSRVQDALLGHVPLHIQDLGSVGVRTTLSSY